MGLKSLGLVPFLISLAWTMMMYPSLVTAASTVLVAGLTGLGGPALAGTFAMTPWLVLAVVHKEEG